MGPFYGQALTRHGYGDEIAALAASPSTPPSQVVPRLVDEVTLCGDPEQALARLDDWYAAGADAPCLVLPPGHDVAELEKLLVSLA